MAFDFQARMAELKKKQTEDAMREREHLNELRNQLTGGTQTDIVQGTPGAVSAGVMAQPVMPDNTVTQPVVQTEPAVVPQSAVQESSAASASAPVAEQAVVSSAPVSQETVVSPAPPVQSVVQAVSPAKPDVLLQQTPVQSAVTQRVSASSVAKPARVQSKPAAKKSDGSSVLVSDPYDTKQVRSVYSIAAEIATRQFPNSSIGDAISAYIIANSDYRPDVPEELGELIDSYQRNSILNDIAKQNESVDERLARLENVVRIVAAGMQEIELGVSYLIADRKGITREAANAQLGGHGINMLEEVVTQTMDRLHEQTRQYLNMKRVQEGRRTTPPQ